MMVSFIRFFQVRFLFCLIASSKDHPPSYTSIMERVRIAKKESNNPFDFLKKLTMLSFNSSKLLLSISFFFNFLNLISFIIVVLIVVVFFLSILPVSMVAIGKTFTNIESSS